MNIRVLTCILFAIMPAAYAAEKPASATAGETQEISPEMKAAPDVHDHSNGALIWSVNGDKLPEINSRIILRLYPQLKP